MRPASLGMILILTAAGCREVKPPSDCGSESADLCRVDTLTVDGAKRTVVVSNRFPPDCAAGRVPLLIFFHGSGSNGIEARTDYAYFEEGIGSNARFLYPDGLPRADTDGTNSWNRDPTGDDVRLVEALVSTWTQDACIDPARVFAVGHSRGGRFIEVLACHKSGLFRGFAEASAGTNNVQSCPDTAPILVAHAKDDEQVPYAEGVAMRDRWAQRNGCTAPSGDFPTNQCTPLTCTADPVWWCPYEGATWRGHYPPPFFGTEAWKLFQSL